MSDESKKRPQSSPEDVESALYGGIPMGRWKEGLLFDGIAPTPGLKSAANWFPRMEKLGPDECRWLFDESGEAKAWYDDQEPFVREQQIDPAEYYPDGYEPILLEDWPVDGDLVVDMERLPPELVQGMGESWRDRKAYKKHISELTSETESDE
jgi:hypothetical protein